MRLSAGELACSSNSRMEGLDVGRDMERGRGGGIAGISVGGVIVIVGIVVAVAWSLLLGLIIVLVGLIAFGGFARGKWY